MKILSIFALTLALSGAFVGNSVQAQTAPSQKINAIFSQIDAAIAAGDVDAIAALIADAVVANPALADQVLAYAVQVAPAAAPKIAAAITVRSPEAGVKSTQKLTAELAKNPANEALIASVFEQGAPAAGRANPPVPFLQLAQQAIQRANQNALNNIPKENPSQSSGN